MTLFDSERDYRQIIRDAYQERLNEDSSYTWRQFSRLVNISPSRMSEVMSGKGNLTTRSARLIAEGLGFTPMEADYFRLLIQSEAAQYKEERARSLRQARVLRCRHHLSRLGTDIEGQPGAIDLALCEYLLDDPATEEDLCRDLNFSGDRIKTSLKTLLAHGYVQPSGVSGQYQVTEKYRRVPRSMFSTVEPQINLDLLEYNIGTMAGTGMAAVEGRSTVMTLDEDGWKELQAAIDGFMKRYDEKKPAPGKGRRVCTFSIQMNVLSRGRFPG